jgi:hypothetical protein
MNMIWNWIKMLFKHNIKIPTAAGPIAKTVAKQIKNEISPASINQVFDEMMNTAKEQWMGNTKKKKYHRKKSNAKKPNAKKSNAKKV